MSLIAAFGSAALDEVARSACQGWGVAARRTDPGRASVDASSRPSPSRSGDEALVLWLHDVTAARRAGEARRDFVANISHELRTPLASIKLLAETLADGAVAG